MTAGHHEAGHHATEHNNGTDNYEHKQSDRAWKSTVLPNRRAAELIVELAHRLAALLSVNADLREFSTQWLLLVNASVCVAKTDRAIRPEFAAHLLCCAALVRLLFQVGTDGTKPAWHERNR
jgi:hypothetical protein